MKPKDCAQCQIIAIYQGLVKDQRDTIRLLSEKQRKKGVKRISKIELYQLN